MVKHSIRLSSAEIGGLWANYILESMTICLLKYFLYHNQDEEIKPLLEKALKNAEGHIQKISAISFTSLNAIDITLIGHAMSVSMRSDLVAHYQKYISEIMVYAGKGFNLLVDRGWSQQPPMAPNRKELENMK